MNGSEIAQVKQAKLLGNVIDEGLNWSEQFRKVKGKVAGRFWSLKKLINIAPHYQLFNINHTLLESHVRYANVVWESISSSKLETLQRLQKRAHSIMQKARLIDK